MRGGKRGRRDFLKRGLGALVAGGCLGRMSLEEALAQAQKAGKPLLSPQAITSRIPPPTNEAEFHKAVDFAKRDLKGYLQSCCHPPDAFWGKFGQLTSSDISQLNAALGQAAQKKLKIRVQSGSPQGRFRLGTQITQDSLVITAHGGGATQGQTQ
jgi:hypothetical protein